LKAATNVALEMSKFGVTGNDCDKEAEGNRPGVYWKQALKSEKPPKKSPRTKEAVE
jgi:hypothetical protein